MVVDTSALVAVIFGLGTVFVLGRFRDENPPPSVVLAAEHYNMVARMVADIMTKEKLVTQPITVVNKPGGGGAIAAMKTCPVRNFCSPPWIFCWKVVTGMKTASS